MATIRLLFNGSPAGFIEFNFTDEANLIGSPDMSAVNLPEPQRQEIGRLLRGNPERIPIVGGYAPDDISGFYEGILGVLERIPGLSFDAPSLSVDLPDGIAF